MKNAELQERIENALDTALASLTPSARDKTMIITNAMEGKKVRKLRFTAKTILIFGLILLMISATVLAAVLLSPREVVEQVAVPMAQGNDKDWRVEMEFTPEQLAAFILACNENGIDLDENNAIMEAIRNGEGYDEEEAIMAVCRAAFGGVWGEWTIAERHWFQEMMVAIGFADAVYEELPGPDDLTEEEAKARMLAAIRGKYGENLPLEDKSLFLSHVGFTAEGAENGTAWTLQINSRSGSKVNEEYIAELDRTGKVLDVSHTVYEAPVAGSEAISWRLTEAEAVRLAAEGVRAQTGKDVPLEDPEKYHYYCVRGASEPLTWTINFISHTVDWGFVSTAVGDATGHVTVHQADVEAISADSILARYRSAYGWYDSWDSARWAEVSAAAADLPAETMIGKVTKATPWIAWREGLLTREEAEKQAFINTGVRVGDVNCACLIDAEPHPFWKFRLLPYSEAYQDSIVVEIDAVTGEMTDLDLYKSDHTDLEPTFHMITLHRIWARLELEENGPTYLARLAVLHRFADNSFDMPEVDDLPIFDESFWLPAIEDGTVRFRSRWSNLPDYQVTLDENGVATDAVMLESSGTEALPEDRMPGGNG